MDNPPISERDRTRIRDAVAAAEANTSGEIFPVVAEASDDYRLVPILWATIIALIVPLPLIFLTLWPASLIFLVQLAAFVVLAVVFSLDAIRPLLLPQSVKREAARALAIRQFMAHGLHTTELRTGVLIFVSLAERHAEIIADEGIARQVDPMVWQNVMERLTSAIRAGRLADGLVAAIGEAGTVLAQHFPPRSGDRNELPDDLVLL
ncbi:MAG TPA: TPM domain-containing protein [Xanthobacteraceae bacterium]|nr:TPM domain-containing protein [Xanthobacteraceae bacterium]